LRINNLGVHNNDSKTRTLLLLSIVVWYGWVVLKNESSFDTCPCIYIQTVNIYTQSDFSSMAIPNVINLHETIN